MDFLQILAVCGGSVHSIGSTKLIIIYKSIWLEKMLNLKVGSIK